LLSAQKRVLLESVIKKVIVDVKDPAKSRFVGEIVKYLIDGGSGLRPKGDRTV
jgi:hypothetical protein|tara:strand:+ start:56 stop:214 length:159 start_codon:yes stop_codon:yes gene_type:complete